MNEEKTIVMCVKTNYVHRKRLVNRILDYLVEEGVEYLSKDIAEIVMTFETEED